MNPLNATSFNTPMIPIPKQPFMSPPRQNQRRNPNRCSQQPKRKPHAKRNRIRTIIFLLPILRNYQLRCCGSRIYYSRVWRRILTWRSWGWWSSDPNACCEDRKESDIEMSPLTLQARGSRGFRRDVVDDCGGIRFQGLRYSDLFLSDSYFCSGLRFHGSGLRFHGCRSCASQSWVCRCGCIICLTISAEEIYGLFFFKRVRTAVVHAGF